MGLRGCLTPHCMSIHMVVAGPLGLLLAALLLAAWLAVTVYVYRDASLRYPRGSLAPLIWALATLLGGPLVLLFYLLVRPPRGRGEGG